MIFKRNLNLIDLWFAKQTNKNFKSWMYIITQNYLNNQTIQNKIIIH